jgi:hypothetical protein
MKQLKIRGRDLTREQAAVELQSFANEWKFQYLDIKIPPNFQPSSDCARWVPDWWDEGRFGVWHDLRLVRSRIPPSYRSATSPANFHWVVIAFGEETSDRMKLRPPYDRIYFWRCFNCPALNGTLSMDRHLAALLKALSFKHLYRSTAKTVNILNTVAEPNRQTTQILPPTQQSVNIPDSISRRSRNTRELLGNLPNPLYDLRFSSVRTTPFPTARCTPSPTARRTPPPTTRSTPPPTASTTPPTTSTPLPTSSTPPPTASTPPPFTANSESENDVIEDSDVNNNNDINGQQNPSQNSSQSAPASSNRNQDEVAPGESARRGRGRPAGGRGGQAHGTSRNASPSFLLERHLGDLDPSRIYIIPDASQNQPSQGDTFDVSQLQSAGLLNDSNICSLISLFLSFHRIGIKDHMIDPHFCFTLNRTFDFPSLVFLKVLSAMPSQNSFSLQLFIETWNNSSKAPRIHPGFSDIAALAEGIVSNLQMKQYANKPPVITEFLGTFHCRKCGKDHVRVKNWELQVQAAIPLLQLPNHDQQVDLFELLGSFLDEPLETRCSNLNCKHRITDGVLEVKTGFYTILAVNRFDVQNHNNKRMNKLTLTSNPGQLHLGELVSVICHRGDVNRGHFVSYHRVEQEWFLNDDSRPCTPSNNPLEGRNADSETVELLFFQK